MYGGSLLWLAGCPYLFEAPDLSNVVEPCTDDCSSEADETGSDAETTGDTGPQTPDLPPVIGSFSLSPRSDGVVVHYEAIDPDSDWAGGAAEVSDGVMAWSLAIPDQLTDWRPEGRSSATIGRLPWLDCTVPVDEQWSLVLVDAAGHRSEPAQARMQIEAIGEMAETDWPNDWPESIGAVALSPPTVGCVVFDTQPEDPRPPVAQLTRDAEGLIFQTPDDQNYVAELWWGGHADLDLLVYELPLNDLDGDGIYDSLVHSWETGAVDERLVWTGFTGRDFIVDFTFYEPLGPPVPPYHATFLLTPE